MRVISEMVFEDEIQIPKNPEEYPNIVSYNPGKDYTETDEEYLIDRASVIKRLPSDYRKKIINKEPFTIEVITRRIITFELDSRVRVTWKGTAPNMSELIEDEQGVVFIVDGYNSIVPLHTRDILKVVPGTIFKSQKRSEQFIIKSAE